MDSTLSPAYLQHLVEEENLLGHAFPDHMSCSVLGDLEEILDFSCHVLGGQKGSNITIATTHHSYWACGGIQYLLRGLL